MTRLRSESNRNDLGEVVAQLVAEVTEMKQEILSERWQQVAANFAQIDRNFTQLLARVEALEDAHRRATAVN